jgi:predicted NodU family carbamoyl transferase
MYRARRRTLFAVAEERISRIKHHAGFPRLAIQAVTGVPVIMNTSFNLRGQAIVHTPTDALRTFSSSGMDGLVIGSFLGEK